MLEKKKRVSSGISQLDRILGNIFIGDNVIWYDQAGSLAFAFSYNLILDSISRKKSIIYVNFDLSPRNILEKLGNLAENQYLTILDCFTHGKGDSSEIFAKFYEKDGAHWPYQVIMLKEPANAEAVYEAVYGLHQNMSGNVRIIFESLTGMQDLWGGEESIKKFYSHTCPKLYELDTVAYWIIEKDAHSDQLKAYINQIAQVAIDLSMQKGKSSLTLLKAEKRNMSNLKQAYFFWQQGTHVFFDEEMPNGIRVDIGFKVREIRIKQGMTQKELASLVGVAPSTVSQVEGSITYPSLPVLLKMAEALGVGVSAFFSEWKRKKSKPVFRIDKGQEINFKDLPQESIKGISIFPLDWETDLEAYLIEIAPQSTLPAHFFVHKKEEMGYLLSGNLQVQIREAAYELKQGDLLHLRDDLPDSWKNQGLEKAELLWLKLK